jgi:lipopolysaccharide/colanic/teichoic acid biosynthesis glycosyltransferase
MNEALRTGTVQQRGARLPRLYRDFIDPLLRRTMDVAAAAAGIAILSPLMLAIALAIKLQDGGPALYLASRVGKDGKPFRLYKFRTMVVDAPKQGPGITRAGDPRITPIGRHLRRTKLDELPQLVNVLCGDMSLVGPRPEDPRYVAMYTPQEREVLRARPGITGPASLAYRHEEAMLSDGDWETRYMDEVLPSKLALDREYLSRRTVWSDLRMVLRTVAAIRK